jgi:hypothetical protein
MRIAPASFAASAFVLVAGLARAADRPRSFYVEEATDEDGEASCGPSVTALAAALAEACEPLHVCRASTSPGGADRKLTLDCREPGQWSLDALDASGTVEWTVVLAGPLEDRPRAAAQEALRFEIGDDPVKVPETPPRVPPAEPITTDRSDAAKVLAIGGFGVATIATIVGVGLAIDRAHRDDASSADKIGTVCSDGPCTRAVVDSSAGTRTSAAAVDIAIGIAVVGAVTGLVGLAIWPRGPARARPTAGLGSWSLRGTF